MSEVSKLLDAGELIDTCWDVNMQDVTCGWGYMSELIDTCWDVNANSATNTATGSSELIDICWDVNADNKTAKMDRIRINRYMLGCKSKHHNLSIDEFKN